MLLVIACSQVDQPNAREDHYPKRNECCLALGGNASTSDIQYHPVYLNAFIIEYPSSIFCYLCKASSGEGQDSRASP